MKRKRSHTKISPLASAIFLAAAILAGTLTAKEDSTTTVNQTDKKMLENGRTEEGEMEVHFLDIGQGDSSLVMCGEHAMLIDAGDNDKGTAVQLYLKKRGIQKLDYLVLTHPDADHIGGADVVLTKFPVETVFQSAFEKDTKSYRDVEDALAYRSIKAQVPQPGDSYQLGDAYFTFVSPNADYEDANNSSLALLLQYGETKFLFTGDCEEEAEYDILNCGINIQADVYQTGHHGSRTASSQSFMDAVNPTYAVISCGEGNDYGHPHAEVLNRFRTMGIQVFRTDEQGSIIAYSDGQSITWNCAPSETWQVGE